MNILRDWAAGVCAACIVIAVMQSVMPQNGLQKIFNLTASAFFLICLLSPFNMLGSSSLPAFKSIESSQAKVENNLGEVVNLYALRTFGAETKKLVEGSARKIGIEPLEVNVFINNADGDSISINEIVIKLSGKDEKYEALIKNEVKMITGKEPEVVYAAE